jgi:hypothetical protein
MALMLWLNWSHDDDDDDDPTATFSRFGMLFAAAVARRLERLEFPYVFAAALQAELTARRQQRDKAASSGRFAWMEQVTAAAAADAAAAVGDESAASGAANKPPSQQPTDSSTAAAAAAAHPAAAAAAAPVTAARLHKGLKGISVNVVELEETFAGPVRLAAADTYRPLAGSVKLSSHMLGAAAHAAAAAAGGVGSAAAHVQSGRPLHEVIAAANAQLASRYRRQVASGLRELCEKLQAGTAGSTPAAAAAAAAGGVGTARAAPSAAGGGGGAVANRRGSDLDDSGGINRLWDETEAAAAADDDDAGDDEGDVYATLSLLRRLQLWPVTAALLKSTAAGKQVSSLAKSHPSEMVRSLAGQVVAQWKAILAMQAAAAKAAAEKDAADAKAASKGGGGESSKKAAAGPVVDAELRSRVAVMIRDALLDHRGKVLQQQQQQGGGAAATAAAKPNVPAEEVPQLQELANKLEDELHTHIINSSSNGRNAPAAAGRSGGSGGSSDAVADYKKQARMLCTGLRYPDGIAGQLLTGERAPSQVSKFLTY